MKFRKQSAWLSLVLLLCMVPGVIVFPIVPQGADRMASSSDARPEDEIPIDEISVEAEQDDEEEEEILADVPCDEATRSDATSADAIPEDATPSVIKQAESYGLVLDETSIIVYDYPELKRALSEDNTYTTIYLGNDITTDNSGVVINASKPNLIIDGCPPGEEQHRGYTLTQYNSTALSNTMRIESGNKTTREAVLRNMTIAGGNYYGVIAVLAADVLLTHENIDYSGPQPVYNRNGTTRFTDSTYLLKPAGGIATNELAEAKHTEFSGTVVIDAPSTANSILYLVNTASTLTFLAGSDVTVNTNFYFIYTTGYTPDIVMQPGSRLSLTSTRFGMTYADQKLNSLRMEEGAELNIDLNTGESRAAIRISQLLEMEPGSSMTIIRTGNDGIPLRFTNAGAKAVFNRPKRVLLYSSAGVPLRFTGKGTLEITTSALNVWKEKNWLQEMAIESPPDHIWNKSGGGLLTLTGTYTEAVNNGLVHNLTADDPPVTDLNSTNFNLEKNQLVAFGNMELTIDELRSGSKSISGTADPDTSLRASYMISAENQKNAAGFADTSGIYELELGDDRLIPEYFVRMTGMNNRLFMRQQQMVLPAAGRLELLTVPSDLVFDQTAIPDRIRLFNRQDNSSFQLKVMDSRETPAPWRLDVYLEEPVCITEEGGTINLNGNIVYVSPDNQVQDISEVPVTVFELADDTGGEHIISWQEDEGILLQVFPGNLYSDRSYRTTLHWSLVDAP